MWHRCKNNCAFLPSRPARALWIEMEPIFSICKIMKSRLARALWIEISSKFAKSSIFAVEARESLVDWNEQQLLSWYYDMQSRLARALWIEIVPGYMSITDWPSRLARALWIEILMKVQRPLYALVEARESLVDWNFRPILVIKIWPCRGSWEPCGLKL